VQKNKDKQHKNGPHLWVQLDKFYRFLPRRLHEHRELSVTHAAEQFDVMSPDQQDVNLQRVIGEEVFHVLD